MSNKRNASTPKGALDKDLRLTNSFSALEDLDDQWVDTQRRGRGRGQSHNVVGHLDQPLSNTYVPPTGSRSVSETTGQEKEHLTYSGILQRRDSLTSQGSRGGRRPTNMGDRTIFVTPKPQGGMRDDILIECQTLNGRPFKGTITYKEAKIAIFEEKLGYQQSLLHSIRTSFNGCPVVRYKLNSQINIDDLISTEHFEFERKIPVGNTLRTDIIACRIMGIRGMQSVPNYDTPGNDIRWVKIEGCEYSLEEDQIQDWLKLYGEVLSPICEDIHEDSDSDAQPIGNGTYSVKMKLNRDIPQYLPVHGRRIRIYYKGITKLCTNCFGSHTRRSCTNEKVPWIHYVRDYMLNNEEVSETLYGRWWNIIDKEFPGYFDKEEMQEQEHTEQAKEQDRAQSGIVNPNKQPQGPRQAARFAPKRTDSPAKTELADLMARGLTIEEAKSFIKSKNEQANLMKRMTQIETTFARTNIPQGQVTKVGPRGKSTGRGGLSYN